MFFYNFFCCGVKEGLSRTYKRINNVETINNLLFGWTIKMDELKFKIELLFFFFCSIFSHVLKTRKNHNNNNSIHQKILFHMTKKSIYFPFTKNVKC